MGDGDDLKRAACSMLSAGRAGIHRFPPHPRIPSLRLRCDSSVPSLPSPPPLLSKSSLSSLEYIGKPAIWEMRPGLISGCVRGIGVDRLV